MGKTKTSGKGRLDKFYYLAKEQGFRSRASFKLIQLNRKYQFLDKATSLLDLCAAPGGWLQVAVKYMPMASLIIGVDLVPIRAIRGCKTLTEDITSSKCRAELKKLLKDKPLDVVLHDGSPNVGGAWAKEALSQLALTLDALKLASMFLKPGGIFVTKVFRSQDYHSLIQSFKELFKRVEATKPVASRSSSAEIYVICTGFKAPAKLDPHLFDVRHVFKEVVEPAKVVDVLSERKQKRHREGYEEGAVLLDKVAPVLEFISSLKPIELLGTVHSLNFEGPQAEQIAQQAATDQEVLSLCSDLRVLGKSEFKHLLKWRMKVRKALPDLCQGGKVETGEEKEPAAKEVEGGEEGEEKAAAAELEELEAMRVAIEARGRQALRREKKRQTKLRKASVFGTTPDVTASGEDVYGEDGLFSLSHIRTGKQLRKVEQEDEEAEEREQAEENSSDSAQSDGLSDEEEDSSERYVQEMESYFDQAYDQFCSAREGPGRAKRRIRARLAQSKVGKSGEGAVEAEADMGDDGEGRDSAEEAEEAEEENPLLMSLQDKEKPDEPAVAKKKLAASWFSQDVFEGFREGSGEGLGKGLAVAEEVGASEEEEVEDEEKFERAVVAASSGGGFEVVRAQSPCSSSSGEGSSSESEGEGYNSEERAETLAYARRMLRKKEREELLDEGYNRLTFNDVELPRWFAEDQRKFYSVLKPITKEEVQAIREQERAINARPVKKVAEAKARKRRVALKKLEAVKKKASAIADQPDLNNRSKNKLMENLYRHHDAASKKQGKKNVVVARKGSKGNRGKGAKNSIMVDKRMKADKRGEERRSAKAKGKSKKRS